MYPNLDEINSISDNSVIEMKSLYSYQNLDLKDANSINLFKENEFFSNFFAFEKETTSAEIPLKNSNIQPIDANNPTNGIYTFEKIKKILWDCNNCELNDILKNIPIKPIEKERFYLILMKSKKFKYQKLEKKILEDKIIFKRGRKKGNDLEKRKHNKFSSDNVIKKIKANLFKNMILFCNNILKSANINITLKNINYNIINNINKKNELKQFEMALKELISEEISPKYNSYNADYNKKKIIEILKERKDNKVLNFIFNMTFRQWIDIFILKQNIRDYKNEEYLSVLDEGNYKEIENQMPKVSETLINVLEKNGIEYLSFYIFYLYNYEKWFISKRNRRKKII